MIKVSFICVIKTKNFFDLHISNNAREGMLGEDILR